MPKALNIMRVGMLGLLGAFIVAPNAFAANSVSPTNITLEQLATPDVTITVTTDGAWYAFAGGTNTGLIELGEGSGSFHYGTDYNTPEQSILDFPVHVLFLSQPDFAACGDDPPNSTMQTCLASAYFDNEIVVSLGSGVIASAFSPTIAAGMLSTSIAGGFSTGAFEIVLTILAVLAALLLLGFSLRKVKQHITGKRF